MHPTLIRFGSFVISTYEVALTAAFVMAIYLAMRRAPKESLDRGLVLDVCLWLVIGGLVGARVLYILTQADNYWNACFHPALVKPEPLKEADCLLALNPFRGGFVYYGGFIGGVIAVAIVTRRRREPFFPLADVLAPYLMLGLAFHRAVGCFWGAGCCYGSPTSLPWGVMWPSGSQPYGSYPHIAIHPTQLYEALFGFGLFAFLCWYRDRKRFAGEIVVIMVAGYAAFRFVNEFMRGDKIRGFVVGPISTSQLISLGLVVLAFLWWRRARRAASLASPPPTS